MFGRNGQWLSRLEFHLLELRLSHDIAGEGDVLRGRVVASASVRRADMFPAFNRTNMAQCRVSAPLLKAATQATAASKACLGSKWLKIIQLRYCSAVIDAQFCTATNYGSGEGKPTECIVSACL